MLTRAIFIRPDIELIWESVWKGNVRNCLLVKNMSDMQKSNRERTKTLTDYPGIYFLRYIS
jgi:hypothetical protein